MKYNIATHTDVGISKETNQDSYGIKVAETEKGTILLAILCDGMGGLSSGEVASASLIRAFSTWFEVDMPYTLAKESYVEEIQYEWERLIKSQNQTIGEYGRNHHIQLGSTLTAMLFLEDGRYLIGHVGDTRAYRITDDALEILTTDQTVVANEVRLGHITKEEAEVDPRRNVLLQCVGASRIVEPEFILGEIQANECYMLCSDGFRHEITQQEMQDAFMPSVNHEEGQMKEHLIQLVEWNKEREERDNITAILIKTL